jgi:hypothetical protein
MSSIPDAFGTLKIQTQLKDPTYERNGKSYIDPSLTVWTDIQVVEEEDCTHLETICNYCANSWLTDYWVRTVNVKSGRVLGINEVPGIPNLIDLE